MNYLGRLKSWIKAKIVNKETQKYKVEIAILSALILLFVSSLIFSESVRFFGKEHPGILIVAISVACEVVCDFRAEKNLLERIKIFFGICLVVGLLLEIIEAAKSDIQVEKLREGNLVLQTNVDSLNSVVLQLAHEYDLSTNALAEANVRLAQARSEAKELETKLKPRNISPQARTNLALQLNWVPRGTVEIVMSDRDAECMAFGLEIKKALIAAGFQNVVFSPRDIFRAIEMFPEAANSGTDLIFCVKNASSPPSCAVLTLSCLRNDKIDARGWPYNDSLGTNDFQIWVLPRPIHIDE
jgi:hypothetical protein